MERRVVTVLGYDDLGICETWRELSPQAAPSPTRPDYRRRSHTLSKCTIVFSIHAWPLRYMYILNQNIIAKHKRLYTRNLWDYSCWYNVKRHGLAQPIVVG